MIFFIKGLTCGVKVDLLGGVLVLKRVSGMVPEENSGRAGVWFPHSCPMKHLTWRVGSQFRNGDAVPRNPRGCAILK